MAHDPTISPHHRFGNVIKKKFREKNLAVFRHAGLAKCITGVLRTLHLVGGAQTGTSSLKSTQLAHIPSLAHRVMTYLVLIDFNGQIIGLTYVQVDQCINSGTR